MTTTPLDDPKLEATARILAVWSSNHLRAKAPYNFGATVEYQRSVVPCCIDGARAMLAEAFRQAEALTGIVAALEGMTCLELADSHDADEQRAALEAAHAALAAWNAIAGEGK